MPLSNIYQPPYYQPRLPIGGGGGVIRIPAKPKMFGETGLSDIAKIFVEAKEKKRQRGIDERRLDLEEEYKRAQIERLGRTGQPTRAGQIGQYMSGLEPGSEEWLKAAGIRGEPERTAEDILKDIKALGAIKQYEGEGAKNELIDMRMRQLVSELAELQGMGIEEMPGTPSKESWLPFGWGDKPAVPPTRKLVPKKVGAGLEGIARKQFAPDMKLLPPSEPEAWKKSMKLLPPTKGVAPEEMTPLAKPKTRKKHLAEYKRLGGGKTKAGRDYADKYLQ